MAMAPDIVPPVKASLAASAVSVYVLVAASCAFVGFPMPVILAVPMAMAPDMVIAAKVEVPVPVTSPSKFPVTLPMTAPVCTPAELPVKLPVTLPVTLPVKPPTKPTVAVTVEPRTVLAVVAPSVVLSIVPPEIVTLAKLLDPVEVTLPTKLPVTLPVKLPVTLPIMLAVMLPLADMVVNAPVDGDVAPIGVLLRVEDVMAKDCKAEDAIKAVPAVLTIATL